MRNFHLTFAYPWAPWLFFLLIPVALLTLIPYFRMDKRYRKTRNRIVSMVLHMLIMTLAVFVLTGVTFVYEVGNPENELLLLVDMSDTTEGAEDARDELVESIIRESAYDGFKVGVVTFGFTQVNAVPFTYDTDSVYDDYLAAPLPDTTATDIAAALRYARSLFTNPETSKIVLVTDGKETDEQATAAIGSIASQGTRVDAVYVSSAFERDSVQVTDVQFPDYHIDVGDPCEITVTVHSKVATDASSLEIFDNGTALPDLTLPVSLSEGAQTFVFTTTFAQEGLHEIRVRVNESRDAMRDNNEYFSYYYLQRFNRVLVLEQAEGESEELKALLEAEDAGYTADIIDLTNEREKVPTTVDALRAYDQVILNNISNADLQSTKTDPDSVGLDELLYSYVYDYGGGLLTVGGKEADNEQVAHAYNRADMYGSLYQKMLPVDVIEYTPPVAVVFLIDISGSMNGEGKETNLYWAKQGAIECIRALTERDFMGVMTLADVYGDVLPLTPCTQPWVIREAIDKIDGTGGTVYSDTIKRAGQKLSQWKGVEKRHIVVVSDGAPSPGDKDYYLEATRENYENYGVTLSFIGIGIQPTEEPAMNELVEAGHGGYHNVDTGNLEKLVSEMVDDLNAPEIKEMDDEPFHPQVYDDALLSPLVSGLFKSSITLDDGTVVANAFEAEMGGFYGTKARPDAEVVLKGDAAAPLYAQWKFGAGMVGSFLSDLHGVWAEDFMKDENGRHFLLNVVSNLMPLTDITPNEIAANLNGDNYINQLNVYTDLEEGQTIRAVLTDVTAGTEYSLNQVTEFEEGQPMPSIYVTLALDASNSYSRCNFVVKKSGTYRIRLEKCAADGTVLEEYETYKSFAYSLEYDQTLDGADYTDYLTALAARGNGSLIVSEDDITKIFEDFATSISHVFDPRWLFAGLAIALFLLDIAARKFKFKWPHELVREHREKREKMNKTQGRRR